MVKKPTDNAVEVRDMGQLGSGRSLGEGMATHNSILAWRNSILECSYGQRNLVGYS